MERRNQKQGGGGGKGGGGAQKKKKKKNKDVELLTGTDAERKGLELSPGDQRGVTGGLKRDLETGTKKENEKKMKSL